MGRSRPIPEQPLFRAPGEAVAESMVTSGELDKSARCELPGCDADVPQAVGNEGRVRYCSYEHRREARALRRRARYGGER
jgi:hypothetical protein